MSKYVILTTDNAFSRIAEDVASKDYWINNFVDLGSFHEISDTDYEDIIRYKKVFTAKAPFDSTLVNAPTVDESFTKEEVKIQLDHLIKRLTELTVGKTGRPAIWTTSLNSLKQINLDSITFPVNAQNWVDVLMKNSISVPSSMEF